MARPKKINPDAIYQPLRAVEHMTGLSHYYLRQGVTSGRIPAIRMGRDWRIDYPLFLELLRREEATDD